MTSGREMKQRSKKLLFVVMDFGLAAARRPGMTKGEKTT